MKQTKNLKLSFGFFYGFAGSEEKKELKRQY